MTLLAERERCSKIRVMPTYEVRCPDLDDWPKVRLFHEEFQSSPYFSRLRITMDTLKLYFWAAINPQSPIGILLLFKDQILNGMGVLELVQERIDGQMAQRALIRGAYIASHEPKEAGEALQIAGERWARDRGCDMMIGYVRLGGDGKNGFKHRAAKMRYGFRPLYTVVGKSIDPTEKDVK